MRCGYTINFVPGDPADSLFPPGWAKQRGMTINTSLNPTDPDD